MTQLGQHVLKECASLLGDIYMTRLGKAVACLPEADLWWRPHEGVISVGNILLHLEGNVLQWILSGLLGMPDERSRRSEFEATSGSAKELLGRLESTVQAAAGGLLAMEEGSLLEYVVIQGFETTRIAAVLHVTEHFSWHVGQATWIAKARAGADHGLSFYNEDQINAARNP
jgi:uncharacterized damage-inducible protein DinB